jgi:hypothetical protein
MPEQLQIFFESFIVCKSAIFNPQSSLTFPAKRVEFRHCGAVEELADAEDLKSCGGDSLC